MLMIVWKEVRVSVTEHFANVWNQHYFNRFNCVQHFLYKVGIIEGNNDPIVIVTLGVSIYKQPI